MNIQLLQQGSVTVASARRTSAHTLIELMVAIGIFSLVALGLISAHLFGLRQAGLVESKLGASDLSRRVFGKITSEIRAAQLLRIGNGTLTDFVSLTNGVLQQGNALQFSLTTDTNVFIRYYFETNNARLCRMASGESGYSVIANYLTNGMLFRAQDYRGSNVTDLTYKSVIQIALEFCQYQYPLTRVGPGYYYDYYRLQFKVTPHCPQLQ
jgi:hypothetical protein